MLEKMIVEHCSPALAGLKTANMFTCKFSSFDTFSGELLDIKKKLSEKGVFVEILRINGNRALVYVYRKKRLENPTGHGACGAESRSMQSAGPDRSIPPLMESLPHRSIAALHGMPSAEKKVKHTICFLLFVIIGKLLTIFTFGPG